MTQLSHKAFQMLRITQNAIQETLDETVRLHECGTLVRFHGEVQARVAQDQPFLDAYIKKGKQSLGMVRGKEGTLIRGGYTSGAYLTFRMFEAQARLNEQRLPRISEIALQRVDKHALEMLEIYGASAKTCELERIQKENPDFGSYVLKYVQEQAPHEMVARGFALGAITAYSAFEAAYAEA